MSTSSLSAIARIRVRRPPSEVFRAFADAREMSRFWFTRRDDGLREGESVSWSVGSGADAVSFEVRVIELREPETIVIEWAGFDGAPTRVAWSFEARRRAGWRGTRARGR